MKSKTTLRILREQDLRKILSVNKGLEIIEKTFRDYGSSMTQRLSDPTSLFSGSGQEGDAKFKVKGATLMTEGVTGIRLVSDLPVSKALGPTICFVYVTIERVPRLD